MELDKDNLPFNFPYQLSTSVKNQEVFSNYGSSSIIDINEDGKIVSPKTKGQNCTRFSAVHPVLPLSCEAEKVCLPLKDRVMGDVMEKNKIMKNFCLRMQKSHCNGKRWGRMEHVEDILSNVEDYKTLCGTDDSRSGMVENSAPDMLEALLEKTHIQWFRTLLKDYMQVQGSAGLQFHNSKYTGGCIDSIGVDDTHCYIASAAGQKFDRLRLKFVSQKTDGILQSYNADEIRLGTTIYGTKSRRVQDEDFVTVRTEKECYLYKFNPDAQGRKLNMLNQPRRMCFQAVDISPYIAGECALVDEAGKCYLWYGDSFDDITIKGEPRFDVSDNWRHIQYGSHPRQLVYADQTAVQLFDLRIPNTEGRDLFSLPSKLLYNSERIRTCSKHPASTFYHMVATDYKIMLMDERFSRYPVLKWEHMLTTPPQYMSGVNGADQDDNFIYVASQYPADVHAFRFSLQDSLPPIAVSQPHRAAKLTDISKWPQFVTKCPNTDILHNRLDTSLAGIATTSWKQGHVVFQMDSYGEIFHQVFSAVQSSADTTFSAGLGSHDLQTLPVAVERAKTWIDSWVEMMKSLLSEQIKTREVHSSLQGMFYYRIPHESCCICQPDLGFMPGGIEVTDKTAYCETCMVLLKDGQNLLNSARKDEVMHCDYKRQLHGLEAVQDLPANTALTKLLRKQWYGEKDSQSFEDILKDWDKEVLEKRSAKKKQRNEDLPEMSEESVMRRILHKPRRAGSSPAHTTSSAGNRSWEPSIVSSTDDDLDGGFILQKQRHRSGKGQRYAVSQQESNESVPSPRKRHKKDRKKTQSLEEDDKSSVRVSADNETVKSLVMGSTDSSMSEIFKLNNQDKSNTVLPVFRSVLTRSRDSRERVTSQPRKPGQTSHENGAVSEFLIPQSVTKTSKSPSKKKHINNENSKRSTKSVHSIDTVSEFSVNTGSEDLFDQDPHTVELSNEDDKLSTVLSVASCKGLFNSQMSKDVSRKLFSSQETGDITLDKIVCSPRKGGVNISPRKAKKRKPVAGF